MPDKRQLGERIKRFRLDRNLTLKEVEVKAKVSATHVSEIERGMTSPTVGALAKIARALGTEPSYFLRSDAYPPVSVVRHADRRVLVYDDWGAKINSRFRASREQKIDFLRRVRDISVRVNYAQDLLNAHKSGRTYGERLREIILMRGEITEIVEDLKANRNLFEQQSEIERALIEINKYLNRGREEYINCHDKVDADAKKGKKIQTSIEQLDMKWTKDFMASGEDYSSNFYDELFESKGKMRTQAYRT